MGRAGRRRMFEHFTWDSIAADMRVRYEELCQQKAGAISKDAGTVSFGQG